MCNTRGLRRSISLYSLLMSHALILEATPDVSFYGAVQQNTLETRSEDTTYKSPEFSALESAELRLADHPAEYVLLMQEVAPALYAPEVKSG